MIKNIQALRAIAALAVVWHHLQMQMHIHLGTPLLGYGGRAGVDLFFVISGFIMFHTTRNGDRSTLQFWKDRAIRIVPMYWLLTFIAAALFWFGVHPGDVRALAPADVAEDMLFLPHFRADLDEYPVLDVGWTLNFEMFFYAIFGLTFFLKSQVRALAAITALFVVGAVAIALNAPLPHALHAYLQPITLEFAAGGALALLYRQPASLPQNSLRWTGLVILAGGFVLLIVGGIVNGEYVNWNYELRALTFGLPSTVIVAGALMLERSGAVVRSPTLLLLGAASFSIYLVHHLVVQALTTAAARVGLASAPVLAIEGLAFFTAAVLVGIAAHKWIELPVTRFLKRSAPSFQPHLSTS